MTFLTQHLGLSIFDPNLGSNNPALFRLYNIVGGKSILIQNKIFSKRKLIKAIYSCDQI